MNRAGMCILRVGICLVLNTFTLSADTVVIHFTGLPANTEHGTFNGFASGTINGTFVDDLICDDWDHITYVPSGTLQYQVSYLDTLQYVRFGNLWGGGPDIKRYRTAAILVQGVIDHPDRTADYQYALWELFSNSTPVYPSAHQLLQDAQNVVNGDISAYTSLFASFRIFTPTGDSAGNQEFLQIHPTPEPSAILLLVTAIALTFAGLARRRPQRKPE